MSVTRLINLIAALSSVFLSGCVGLGAGVLGNDEQNIRNPSIQLAKGVVSTTKGSAPWISAEDLLRYWGPPDSIERASQGREQWQYNFGRRWNGLGLLVAFVPLPLMIPVGHEYIRFTIENGLVVKATTKEDAWVAMYGCVMSAVPHAAGTECTFGLQTNNTRFVGDRHPFKIRVINATDSTVSIVHTDRVFVSQVTPFTLAPRESRNVLNHFLGEILARNTDGKVLTYVGGPPSAYTFDSSISYLIINDHVFPIPPKFWDNWEAHIKEFVESGGSGR